MVETVKTSKAISLLNDHEEMINILQGVIKHFDNGNRYLTKEDFIAIWKKHRPKAFIKKYELRKCLR